MKLAEPSRRHAAAAVLVALACLTLAGGPLFAQSMTGSLTGTVVDTSGAVVVGADVTLVNEASRDVRRTKSNSDGYFAFAAVPSGTYTVAIETPGFAKYEQKGVGLKIGDSRSLRTIKLDVAGLAEEATVTANIELAPLNSGEKSATLTSEQILNFSTVGRSAAELLKVLPGLTPATGVNNRPNFSGEVIGINGNGEGGQQSAAGNYSANGTRQEALDITVDGAPGADPGCNCATSVNPNSEMVAEFKVLQSNFGAEHAKGPVAMTVVSKAGGRDFHGTLYTYVRDYHLNSNEWFANKVGSERVKSKFLYPGFNVSGPVLVPGTGFNKNRDKLFFFLGYERFQQRLDTGFVKSWVPTDAMRNGDFSQAANLGLTGSQVNTVPNFPGGIVPRNLIDPGGRALLNTFPRPNADPNVTGGYNYVDNLLVDQNGTQLLGRLDYNVSENTKMFVRYNRQREVQPFVIGLWWRNGERQVPYPSSISAANQSDSYTASLTHVFNPTLTNETVFGYTFIDFPNAIDDRSKISRAALGYPYQGVFGQSNDQIPSVDAGGWGNTGPLLYNPGGFDPILYATKWQWSAQSNLTKVLGTHTFKGGVYYEHVINKQPGNGDSNGLIELATWDGSSSGNTFADLLTGHGSNYQETSKNVVHNMAYNLFEGFVQDSWKIKSRLTVDYGVRIAYEGPWYDRNGIGMAVFDPSIYDSRAPGSTFPGVTWTAKDANVPLSGTRKPPLYFTPRVGFAYDVKGTGSTVIRGGFGIYRYHEPQAIYSGLLDLPAGFRFDQRGQRLPARRSRSAGWWQHRVQREHDRPRRREAAGDVLLEHHPQPAAALVHEPRDRVRGQQAERPAQRRRGEFQPGADRSHAEQSHRRSQRLPAASELRRPERLPAQPVQQLPRDAVAAQPAAGQVQLHARLHLLEVAGHPGRRLDRGQRRIRVPQGHVGERRRHPQLQLRRGVLRPDERADRVLQLAPRQLEERARQRRPGWLADHRDLDLHQRRAPAGGHQHELRDDGNARGRDSDQRRGGIGLTRRCRRSPILTCDPTVDVPSGFYFNPSCFSAPTPGNNGNFIFPYIKGQPYTNHDLSLFKNFNIGSKGQKLQFRTSAYNVFNHPIAFPDPTTNLILNFDNGVLSNPEFAKKNDNNKFGRRIIQLALRYSF